MKKKGKHCYPVDEFKIGTGTMERHGGHSKKMKCRKILCSLKNSSENWFSNNIEIV